MSETMKEKDYQEKINSLFNKWIDEYQKEDKESFVKDGVPFPEYYFSNTPRILFVLKDPNDPKANFESSQLGSYRDFGEFKGDDWHNGMKQRIAAMYKALSKQTELKDEDAIRNIAFMNLKKTGGTNNVCSRVIAKYASCDRDNILEEISIINPEYIVCCGCCIQFLKQIVLNLPFNYRGRWRKRVEKIGGYTYIWKEHNIKIIDMYHPSYTRKGYANKESYITEFKRRISDDI